MYHIYKLNILHKNIDIKKFYDILLINNDVFKMLNKT